MATEDSCYIVAAEQPTLKKHYAALGLGISFQAYVTDGAELAVPDDLDGTAAAAERAHRGVRHIFLSRWAVYAEDLNTAVEVETPHEDLDDCTRQPGTLLTSPYEVHKYKEYQYRACAEAVP